MGGRPDPARSRCTGLWMPFEVDSDATATTDMLKVECEFKWK